MAEAARIGQMPAAGALTHQSYTPHLRCGWPYLALLSRADPWYRGSTPHSVLQMKTAPQIVTETFATQP
jgi:hypothetical protein